MNSYSLKCCKTVLSILFLFILWQYSSNTTNSDQPYLLSAQAETFKNRSDCDIDNECNKKNEINNSQESSNNNNTSLHSCVSPTIENRTRNPKRERRPDRAVYVPRHRRLNSSPVVNSNTPPYSNSNIENDKPISVGTTTSSRTTLQKPIVEGEPITQPNKRNSQLCDIELMKENNSTNNNNISNEIKLLSSNNNNTNKCNNSNNTSSNINNIFTTSIKIDRNPNEVSTKLITDSNNSPPKQNYTDFRVERNTDQQHQNPSEEKDNFRMHRKGPIKCTPQELNDIDKKIFKPSLECQIKNESNSIKSHSKTKKAYDKEMDDWDTLYDENGDCVDPNLSLSELTISVDKSPPNERQKSENGRHSRTISTEEFPHVLEVSNFPTEFKTQDLMMLFTSYKSSGFDIKWVDDTHALAIFSSSKIAAEVLSMNHPFVSLKSLPEATTASRNKAKKCSELLQPYRQRPETCVALARRLVTGALGVKLKTSKEELENERRILRNAKEKRILAAKLRDEIWEDC